MYLIMIEVSVFATTKDWHERNCALRKRIDFEDSLKVDSTSIVNSMRCLFGSDCVVDFIYVP